MPALKGWESQAVKADIARAAPLFPEWKEYTDAFNQVALEAEPAKTDLAILGDSHAQHLYSGLKETLPEKNLAVFPASGQAPFIGVATMTENMGNYRKNGYKLMDAAYKTVLANPRIKTVILAHNPECSIGDAIDPDNPDEKNIEAIMERAMRKSLHALHLAGKKVIIVLDNPTLNFDPASLEPRPEVFGQLAGRDRMPRKKAEDRPAREWFNALAKKVAAEFDNVHITDLFDVFCDQEYCRASIDGKSLYWDRSHLTDTGSRVAAKALLQAID